MADFSAYEAAEYNRLGDLERDLLAARRLCRA